jgi:hypothetical protein
MTDPRFPAAAAAAVHKEPVAAINAPAVDDLRLQGTGVGAVTLR